MAWTVPISWRRVAIFAPTDRNQAGCNQRFPKGGSGFRSIALGDRRWTAVAEDGYRRKLISPSEETSAVTA